MSNPVRLGDERVFPSQKDAAAALSVVPSNIANHLARHGHLERVGLGTGRPGNRNAKANQVVVGPIRFRSEKAAAEKLGVPRTTLRRFRSPNPSLATVERVIAAAMRLHAQQARKAALNG